MLKSRESLWAAGKYRHSALLIGPRRERWLLIGRIVVCIGFRLSIIGIYGKNNGNLLVINCQKY